MKKQKVAKEFAKKVVVSYTVTVEGILNTVTHNVTVNPNQPVEIHRDDVCDLTTGKDCKYSDVDVTLTARIREVDDGRKDSLNKVEDEEVRAQAESILKDNLSVFRKALSPLLKTKWDIAIKTTISEFIYHLGSIGGDTLG